MKTPQKSVALSWIIAFLLIAQSLFTAGAQARTISVNELSTSELAETEQYLQTTVKQDLADNTMARVYEAAAAGEDNEPPMTPETREVLAKGAYMVIASALASEGVYLSEHAFTSKVGKLFERLASWGLYPKAFTVGYMGRWQLVGGMSAGTQFNFYIDRGELKVSIYNIYGAQVGTAAQTKVQFYAALCFGSCFGGDPNGWYVGTDASGSVGAGIDGFLEFGIDVTDMLKANLKGESYAIRDGWESKAVYAGVGFDIGFGAGWSLDLFHYRMKMEKVLARPGNDPKKIDPRVMTKYALRIKKKH